MTKVFKLARFLVFFSPVLLLASCATYMMSPINTASNPYAPMPLKQKGESAKTEAYAGVHFSPGANTLNDPGDEFGAGSVQLVVSNATGNFRFSLASHLMLGNYHAKTVNGRNFFYGGTGLSGAVAYAIPFEKNRGEWRVIGVQASGFHEFGAFLKYRKSAVSGFDYVDVDKNIYTAGLFSEVVRQKKSTAFGFRWCTSFSLLKDILHAPETDEFDVDSPEYFSFGSFMRKGRVTGFVQGNFGTAMLTVQIGMLVRLNFRKVN